MENTIEHIQIPIIFEKRDNGVNIPLDQSEMSRLVTKLSLLADLDELERRMTQKKPIQQ